MKICGMLLRPGLALLLTYGVFVSSPPALGSEVKHFRASGSDLLAGQADGVGIDPLGRLRLGRRFERGLTLDEPYAYTASASGERIVVATGNSGKVFVVEGAGEARLLAELPEPEVFAVLALADGTVYAGTSPNGKVYKIGPNGAEPVFAPGERYIWALAQDSAGRLLVATGVEGRLYRVNLGSRTGGSEIILDHADVHLRALLVRGDEVIVGTAGEGRVMARRGEAAWRTLYDGEAPEITGLAAGSGGAVFVASTASEASRVELQPPAAEASPAEASGEAQVNVREGANGTGSRPAAFTGPRTLLLRLEANGASEELARLDKETAYCLVNESSATGVERLWLGTGQGGKLYRFEAGDLVLEHDFDDSQVVAVLPGAAGPRVVTTDGAALYRVAKIKGQRAGTYTSTVLDAKSVASFGSLAWEGEAPTGTRVALEARSGMSDEPDATWSPWLSAAASSAAGSSAAGSSAAGRSATGQGFVFNLGDLPAGRYVQWRASLSGAAENSAVIVAVDVAYRQQNRRPEIKSLEALDPGEVLVPGGFNPGNQAFEPAHPNRDGIFTSLGDPAAENRNKTLWKLGYRTLRWSASDPNGDDLRGRLEVRPEDKPDSWLLLADLLDGDSYGFDSTVLPDGHYRFRLTSSDEKSNSSGEALAAQRTSGSITIDNTVPELLGARRLEDGTMEVEIHDALSPLRQIEFSADAAAWRSAAPVDGLLDGRSEIARFTVPAQYQVLLLRLQDAAFNTKTYNIDLFLNGPKRGRSGGAP